MAQPRQQRQQQQLPLKTVYSIIQIWLISSEEIQREEILMESLEDTDSETEKHKM